MLKSYLVGKDECGIGKLEIYLQNYCPQISIGGIDNGLSNAEEKVNSDLIFLFIDEYFIDFEYLSVKYLGSNHSALICLGKRKGFAYNAMKLNAVDFLLQPYQPTELIKAVHIAKNRIFERRNLEKLDLKASRLIGVPTIKGCEFLHVDDIVKCEGLQNYTRIITKNNTDFICSQNIGELKKILIPLGFFTPHKSYIISLKEMKKYSKEGVIILKDGSQVPLARRRKKALFNRIMHF